MQWTCRFGNLTCEKRGQLLKHYRLKHGGYTRTSPLPCVHKECLCTFKSFNALKVHLSRVHSQIDDHCDATKNVFQCQLCDFNEPCVEKDFFHTCGHISGCTKMYSALTRIVILKQASTLHLMPTKAGTMMAERCIASCSSNRKF